MLKLMKMFTFVSFENVCKTINNIFEWIKKDDEIFEDDETINDEKEWCLIDG